MAEDERQGERIQALFKAGTRTLVEVMIATLGLRFEKESTRLDREKSSQKDVAKLVDEEPIEPFTPFSLLVAPAERIHAAQEDSEARKKIAGAVVEGTAFDKMSDAIASGDMDGDLEPFLMQIEKGFAKAADDMMTDDVAALMKQYGIEERPADAPEAPHISARAKTPIKIDLFPVDWLKER